MSAAHQRVHAAAAAEPKAKLVARPRGIHHGSYRADVLAKYQRSRWAGRALSLHVHRVANGCAQAAWLLFVYQHTSGSPDSKERGLEWSYPLLPEDAAKENGLSVQMNRAARNECVARGFTPRKSTRPEDGKDFYRFRLDFDKLAKAPNGFSPREGAFVPRKPVQPELIAEVGDEKANSADSEATSEQSRATAIAPEPLLLPPGKVAVAAKLDQPAEVEVVHALPCPVAMHSTWSERGKLRIHLSSPSQAGPRVQPAPTLPAGPGLSVVGEIAADGEPPNQPLLPFSNDDLANGLAELGIACEDQDLALVRRELKCGLKYFLGSVAERVNAARPGTKIGHRLLPNLVKSANEKWRNGGEKAQRMSAKPGVEETEIQRRYRQLIESRAREE